MNQEQEFLEAVESGALPLAEFNHAAHVKLAWIYLSGNPLPEAMIRFRNTLRTYAARHGKAAIYHETVTFAYLLLIHESIHRTRSVAASWAEFIEANPRILTHGKKTLLRLYSEQLLASAEARSVFRLPDRWGRQPGP